MSRSTFLRPSPRLLAIAFTLVAASAACAPAGSTDADTSEAISRDDTAAQLNLDQLVLSDVPAGPKSQSELGVSKWHVYVKADSSDVGTVALATDAGGDVRYALVVDGKEGHASVLEFDEAGPKAEGDARAIPPETLQTLLLDVPMLAQKLKEAGVASSGPRTQAAGLVQTAQASAVCLAGALLLTVEALGLWVGSVPLNLTKALALVTDANRRVPAMIDRVNVRGMDLFYKQAVVIDGACAVATGHAPRH